MASGTPLTCGPCQEDKVNTKADIWCYNCNEGLCSTCCSHHKRSKLSRDHKTIDIKSYKPSIHAIRTECGKHGQQLNLYCPTHLMPCCDECISTSHSKCTGIKSLAGVVEKTQIHKSKESLDEDIFSTLKVLNEMVNNKSQNIKRGEQQCDNIKGRIVEFRKKINKHLDQLEGKIYQEITIILNEEKSKALNLITEIGEKKGNLKEMIDQLHAATTHSSKLHSFLEVHQIEQQVHQCQRYVEDLEDDDRAKEFEIKLKQNDEIDKTISKLESLESFGQVFLDKTEITVKRETNVRREAQVESRDQSNINNITMRIEAKREINMEKSMSDMIWLMDGRIIAVEETDKFYLFTPDCKLEKEFSIPGEASSVTQINQDTIAITYPIERAIKIFYMINETVKKVIALFKACYGLSFSNNYLAVGMRKDEIRIIDLEGNTLMSIQVKNESLLHHLVFCNDRVIYNDNTSKAVNCVDRSGKQIWQYKRELSSLRGLCTDTYGNVFVTDFVSNSIIAISKDGKDSKVLISREDGLMTPQCICFKDNESSGFICDHYGKYLAKFNLSCR